MAEFQGKENKNLVEKKDSIVFDAENSENNGKSELVANDELKNSEQGKENIEKTPENTEKITENTEKMPENIEKISGNIEETPEIAKNNQENLQIDENVKNESSEKQLNDVETAETNEVSQNLDNASVDGLGLSQEIVEEKMKQALETQTPKKRKKSLIVNLCLLLVNLVFMFFIVKNLISDVGDSNFGLIIKTQGSKLWWLVGGVLIYCVYIFAQTTMYHVLIKDFTGKSRWWLSYDVAIVGKYYDDITPFAVGGQAFQIVRLTKNGVSAGVATSIPIIKMIINTAINAFVAVLFFVFGMPLIPSSSTLNSLLLLIFEILGVIGLIITVLVVLFMFLVSSGSLFTRSFISGLLRAGYKLKIVKNYRKTFKKVLNQVSEYKLSMSYLWKHKKLLFKMILLCLVECLSYAVIPYFVVMAFAQNIELSPILFLVVCIAKYYISSMASSFIPLPGGTGLIEIAFIFLYSTTVGDNIVWALLVWRLLSYYLIIIHGFVHELGKIGYNFVKNSKRRKIE
jgi:hypothetical protein